MSESVRHNRLSEAAKGLLSQGLRIPSLEIWVLFGRELYKELSGTEFTWTPEGFAKTNIVMSKVQSIFSFILYRIENDQY